MIGVMRSTTRRRVATLAAVALASALAGPARAQSAPSDNERFARALSHYDKGEYAQAIDLWEHLLASLGPTRGWRLLLNLGRSYHAVGDATRAVESYEAFLRALAARSSEEQRAADGARRDAEAELATIRRTYGAIRVERPARGIVLVRVGAGEPRPAGFTVYLKAGTHEVETFAQTSRAKTRAIAVRAGEAIVISAAELDDGEAAPDSAAARNAAAEKPTKQVGPASKSSSRGTILIVGGAVTVLTAGLSAGMYARAKSRREDALALPRDDARYAGAVDDYGAARTLFYASLALPALAVGTTAVLIAVRGDDASTASGPSVTATASRDGFSAGVIGQF